MSTVAPWIKYVLPVIRVLESCMFLRMFLLLFPGMPCLPHKPQGSRFQLRSSDLQRLWDSNTHMPNLPGTHYHTPEAIFLIEK
ncbi:hypothetical protein B296_00044421 [Ensete ventricosum]|uniref:Uncharacterized protein n=1 Tax=Ensete ventricosum TaxID=4639 RepID=A0A426ZBA4_ENSVE|nr:hypothetical protein B296_00044421 [Ensete ventricosum]